MPDIGIKRIPVGNLGGTKLMSVKGFVKSNAKGIGKAVLSAFLMKRINARISQGNGGKVSKYVKLMLVGYLFKKLKVMNIRLQKSDKKVKPVEELESNEKLDGSSKKGVPKIIIGLLAGVTIIYAVKKLAGKGCWHKVQVQ